MKRLQELFDQIVRKIEDYPLPLKRYILLFFAILGFRLSLEFFSNQRLFRADDVLHIGLWFIFIVLAFMIQLHLFSGVKPERIIKLVVCCFSIALTAPIIDILVSQGKFARMNYLSVNSFTDILKSYVTIGGASLSRGATLGIRIEIVLLIIASFNYVYLKTGKILRSVLGTLSIYTVLFVSGIVPYLLTKVNALFGLQFGKNDHSSISFLFLVDLLLLLFLAWLYNPKPTQIKVNIVWIFRVLSALGLTIYGGWLAKSNYPQNWQFDSTTIYTFPLLIILLLLLFLYEGYHFRHPQLAPGRFYIQNGYLVMSLLTALCISFHTLFATIIICSMLFFLHERPLRFYHLPWLSPLFQAVLSVGFLLLGFMTFEAPMIGVPKFVILLTLSVSFTVFLVLFHRFKYIRNSAT